MDIATMISRADQLWASRRDELARTTLDKQRAIVSESASRGFLHSGRLLLLLAELHTEALRNSAPIAWELLIQTHRAMGADSTPETRAALKSWMAARISELRSSASAQIEGDLIRYGGGLQNRRMLEQMDNTEPIANSLISQYGAIIDNYLDDIVNNPQGQPPVTINAQTIGAVLTGDRAKAHVVQNIGMMQEMRELVGLMREVLKHDDKLDQQRKAELIEIADDTRVELDKPAPNETKLMTLFTLLTQSVQTLPAAKPAYDAAKVLLATVGISLP